MSTTHHYLVPSEGTAYMTGRHLVDSYRELHADWNLNYLQDGEIWAEQQLVAELLKRGLYPRYADGSNATEYPRCICQRGTDGGRTYRW